MAVSVVVLIVLKLEGIIVLLLVSSFEVRDMDSLSPNEVEKVGLAVPSYNRVLDGNRI